MKEREYPVRPGEEDCHFYLKTGRCGFGETCRFNHPKVRKQGSCMHGSTCVFEHSKEGHGADPMRQRQKRQRSESSYGPSPKNRDIERQRKEARLKIEQMKQTVCFDEWIQVKEVVKELGYVIIEVQGQWMLGLRGHKERTEKRRRAEKRYNRDGEDSETGIEETDRRTESTTFMEEKDQGRNPDDRADRRRERDARSSENATQMRHGSGQSSEYPVRTGAEDCYFYLKNGHCGYGRSCRFNHPPMRHDGMVQPSQMRHDMVQRSPYPGAGDCRKYLQTGKCSYGPKCRFNHPPTHLAPMPPERANSRPLCKFFQRGDCKYGSGCKFTHSMREDGAEAMRQATTWGRKHGEESSSRPWKRERQARDLEEQKQNKRRVGNLRIGQRLEIPENSNVIAQENAQEQEEIERQRREAEEKAQEERRLQIANQRREARLRLDRMRARALTDNVDQVRDTLKDIGIERKEGDGF